MLGKELFVHVLQVNLAMLNIWLGFVQIQAVFKEFGKDPAGHFVHFPLYLACSLMQTQYFPSHC